MEEQEGEEESMIKNPIVICELLKIDCKSLNVLIKTVNDCKHITSAIINSSKYQTSFLEVTECDMESFNMDMYVHCLNQFGFNTLYLYYNHIVTVVFNSNTICSNIKKLDLSFNYITKDDSIANFVRSAPNLNELHLNSNQLQNVDNLLSTLPNSNIKVLVLDYNKLTEFYLPNGLKLDYLSLIHNELSLKNKHDLATLNPTKVKQVNIINPYEKYELYMFQENRNQLYSVTAFSLYYHIFTIPSISSNFGNKCIPFEIIRGIVIRMLFPESEINEFYELMKNFDQFKKLNNI